MAARTKNRKSWRSEYFEWMAQSIPDQGEVGLHNLPTVMKGGQFGRDVAGSMGMGMVSWMSGPVLFLRPISTEWEDLNTRKLTASAIDKDRDLSQCPRLLELGSSLEEVWKKHPEYAFCWNPPCWKRALNWRLIQWYQYLFTSITPRISIELL